MLDISQADIGLLPGLELPILLDTILLFFFCSIRIAAFLIASPIFGAGYVILPVRILFGMVLTLSVFQNHSIVLDTETMASALGVILIIKEIAIGLSAGLVLTIWFSAASLAGEKIASTSGLAFAAQVDPNTGASTPVISQIFMLFLLVVFLAIDGHLIVLRTLLDSYEFIPIDSIPTLGILIKSGIGAAGSMFLAATVIMLPVSIILLMVNVSIGIMTRSAPTLNLFSFGFPITLLGTFIFLYLSASTIGFAMSDLVEASIQSMQDMIWSISNG
ncbi:MAG: flagellar biosynthetic protein FliR [Rhodobacteraceae bacterium]|nr:MAG: flagellar biosynthetic protein FliR [Paracoccaceae bacterium]